MTLLLVLAGGALGALGRYIVDLRLRHLDLPWGTIAVNVGGSFILGVLAGAGSAVPGPLAAFLGTGFCGALTTWSTFAYQTVDMATHRRRRNAVLNMVITLVAGFAAVWLGAALA